MAIESTKRRIRGLLTHKELWPHTSDAAKG